MATKAAPISAPTPMEDSKALFVRRWGEMSAYWGISRTMAEIHALLFTSTEPVCTDDVMAQLAISRGNASMNLRALVDWGLIEREHVRGDRKEYFVCRTNVWQMFETIIRQRRRREVGPIIETIDRCRKLVEENASADSTGKHGEEVRLYQTRLDEMQQFLKAIGQMVDLLLQLGPEGIKQISGMLRKMAG